MQGNTAIDNLNIPEDVKDEYKEVLESNNGLKVKQFVDTFISRPNKRNFTIRTNTRTCTIGPEQEAELDFDKDGVHINNVTDKKELAAARSIYDNLINQK